jgi:hypothetical protein
MVSGPRRQPSRFVPGLTTLGEDPGKRRHHDRSGDGVRSGARTPARRRRAESSARPRSWSCRRSERAGPGGSIRRGTSRRGQRRSRGAALPGRRSTSSCACPPARFSMGSRRRPPARRRAPRTPARRRRSLSGRARGVPNRSRDRGSRRALPRVSTAAATSVRDDAESTARARRTDRPDARRAGLARSVRHPARQRESNRRAGTGGSQLEDRPGSSGRGSSRLAPPRSALELVFRTKPGAVGTHYRRSVVLKRVLRRRFAPALTKRAARAGSRVHRAGATAG